MIILIEYLEILNKPVAMKSPKKPRMCKTVLPETPLDDRLWKTLTKAIFFFRDLQEGTEHGRGVGAV